MLILKRELQTELSACFLPSLVSGALQPRILGRHPFLRPPGLLLRLLSGTWELLVILFFDDFIVRRSFCLCRNDIKVHAF